MYGSQIMESGTLDDIFYGTAHPYTQGLMKCLPEKAIDEDRQRLVPIGGRARRPDDAPAGLCVRLPLRKLHAFVHLAQTGAVRGIARSLFALLAYGAEEG